jgi:hypothetical protein
VTSGGIGTDRIELSNIHHIPGIASFTSLPINASYLLDEEVFRAVSKEYGWPDIKPKERTVVDIDPVLLSAYARTTYEGPETGTQVVSVRDNKLYIRVNPLAPPPEPEELYPESATDFFILSRNVTFSFRKDAQGVVSELVTHNGTQDYEAKRLSSSDPH